MTTSGAAAKRRLLLVARALGEVNDRLVFIGASVLPLLVDVEHRLSLPRGTMDVDAVAAKMSYVARTKLEESLRKQGFRDAMDSHAGRWRSPTGELFDLSFAGDHLGSTGSAVDNDAIATALVLAGDPPIKHLSGVGFLTMKSAAFRDRGLSAPDDSKDLADIAVLLVGRRELVTEVTAANVETRTLAKNAAVLLLEIPSLSSVLRGHFASRYPVLPETSDELAIESLEVLQQLRSL